MKNDPVSAARDIVAEASATSRHKCPPKRPWWKPRRFAPCTCAVLRRAPVLTAAGIAIADEVRFTTECCQQHGQLPGWKAR